MASCQAGGLRRVCCLWRFLVLGAGCRRRAKDVNGAVLTVPGVLACCSALCRLQVDGSIRTCCEQMLVYVSACRRIMNTPMPFAYIVHLR